jgi:carbamoyl-phosphate synthase small subunit
MNAILALEDGTWYQGIAAGAPGETGGEVVFNTSMTGYQEVLTDPSYAGQIVTMTAPQIGNYGVSAADHESASPQVAGFVMRDESPVASNWRSQGTLREYLTEHGIVAIADVDTRALTRKLRSGGVMRGVIVTGHADPQALVERARSLPSMEGADLVKDVTCDAAYDFEPSLADAVTEAGFGVPPARRASTRFGPGR